MALSIGLLGALVIESEEGGLGKIPKKARALLGYLAAQGGQAISRERLADLLWPYQGSEQARHSLRNCLLELRKALGANAAQYLVSDFAHCRLRDVAVDVDRFERLSRSPQRCELQAAADLYRGEFLADFHIDSEPFQEWLAGERDRALALVCDILQRLTATPEAGELDGAIQSGRRLVALDPLSEFGQRALMRAYARAGRRGEALRQYKSCAETLKRELGVAPDAETQALAAEIARPGPAEEAQWARPRGEPSRRRRGPARPAPPNRGGARRAAGRTGPGNNTTDLALPAVEHRRGGGAAAQSDRRSRAAISGRRLHRRPPHRPVAAQPRALAQADRRRARRLGPAAARRRARLRTRRHRQRPAQRPGDAAGQHADRRRGDGRVSVGRPA